MTPGHCVPWWEPAATVSAAGLGFTSLTASVSAAELGTTSPAATVSAAALWPNCAAVPQLGHSKPSSLHSIDTLMTICAGDHLVNVFILLSNLRCKTFSQSHRGRIAVNPFTRESRIVCAGTAGAAFPPALELQVPLLPTPTGCCELRSVNAVSSPPKPTLNLSCTSLRCTCWLG